MIEGELGRVRRFEIKSENALTTKEHEATGERRGGWDEIVGSRKDGAHLQP
jgi:hypothetical protein